VLPGKEDLNTNNLANKFKKNKNRKSHAENNPLKGKKAKKKKIRY